MEEVLGEVRPVSSRVVRVPTVTDTQVVTAFDRLRAAGLRVAIPHRFSVDSNRVPMPVRQHPAAESSVEWGTVVTLELEGGLTGSLVWSGPGEVVLRDLVGSGLSAAIAWLDGAGLEWSAVDLPPLASADSNSLFDNYQVTSQDRPPGTRFVWRHWRDDPPPSTSRWAPFSRQALGGGRLPGTPIAVVTPAVGFAPSRDRWPLDWIHGRKTEPPSYSPSEPIR